MKPIRAMVMAAGAGTRLRPLTNELPKPMVPIVNRPVLQYTIENLKRHGITDIVLNLHNHPDVIKNYFKDGGAWGVKIEYSYEPELLGTAGGVKKVEAFLKQGTFLVMSGDGLSSVNLKNLLQFHISKKALGTIGLTPVDTRFDYGVTLTHKSGRITRFIEKPKWSDVFSNQVNTGIYVFESEALAFIPKGRIYDFGHELWPLLLKKKKPIFGYAIKDYWCDVGNLNEYRRAQRDVLDGRAGIVPPGRQIQPGVWAEEGSQIDSTVVFDAPCLIGRKAQIDRGAKIGSHTVIGHHCRIGAGSLVRNCTLWDEVQVGANVRLEHCVIGQKARVTENLSMFEGTVIQAA
jgi:mannose-1-phosphate guanylyltransferase/phosphomannomutase